MTNEDIRVIENLKQPRDSYSPAFIRIYGFLVTTGNRFGKAFRMFRHYLYGRRVSTQSDEQALLLFENLIPNLPSYEKTGLLYQLRDRAIKKKADGLEAYYNYLTAHPGELAELKENLTFVGSHFFRDNIWDRLQDLCRTAFPSRDRIRIWSAGCASGKEAYSTLMMLTDLMSPDRIDLLATDYNQQMLRLCKEAVYSLRTIDEIPPRYRKFTERFRSRRGDGSPREFSQRFRFRIRQELRDRVRTQPLNLLTDTFPEGFDLISCRNVIRFFEPPVRQEILRKLTASLNPGGILVVSGDLSKEGIADPAALGMTQIDGLCIYRKDARQG